jgi:hypothetical protein
MVGTEINFHEFLTSVLEAGECSVKSPTVLTLLTISRGLCGPQNNSGHVNERENPNAHDKDGIRDVNF